MSVKPLKQLFAEADSFIGESHSKTASSAAFPSDSVSELAEQLINAGAVEKVAGTSTEAKPDASYEKIAMAVNRAEALKQIEQFEKYAQFFEKAEAAGYSEAQISEAVEKLAAKELKTKLPALTALSANHVSGGEGKNSLDPKKVNAKDIGQGKIDKSVTNNSGYGV